MLARVKSRLILAATAGILMSVASATNRARAQGYQRYQPSRPTVSPYLNLFQNNRNGGFNRAVPNYYSLVRPQLQQQQINANQQDLLNQQGGTLQQLQSNVQVLQQQQEGAPVVTGHNSWFFNTSRYFAQVGTGGIGQNGQSRTANSASSRAASSARRR